MERTIEILDPRAQQRETASARSATRLPLLRGARVGFLDNSKNNADVLLGRMRELMAAEFGIEAVWHRKHTSGHPTKQEVMDDLAKCKAVVTSNAD